MPLNTRVGRCVTKLRNKYGYGKAIGICQHSTKQNYLTGKTMRRKKKGGTKPEPNDGLIYARDFVNVAQEPDQMVGQSLEMDYPNTPSPPLKLPGKGANRKQVSSLYI